MSVIGVVAGQLLATVTAVVLAWKWQLGVRRTGLAVLVLGAVAAGLEAALIAHVHSALQEQIGVHWGLTMAAGLACLGAMFYRDPPRVAPAVPGAVLSPADGVVVYVRDVCGGVLPVATKKGRSYTLGELTRSSLHGDDAVVIGISMNLLDVHVNRVPVTGRVAQCSRYPGSFGSLRRPEMIFENERATTVIEQDGFSVAVVQIASRLVRRIALFITPEQAVVAGDRLGAIRMGSQVDVVIPRREGVRVTARTGDRLRAGESVIAVVDRDPAPAGALVVGGDVRGLCIARSLGKRGVPVWVAVTDGGMPTLASSRYVRRVVRLPGDAERNLAERLIELGERSSLRGWVLFPTTDEAAAQIARAHARLGAFFTLATPAWDVLQWAYDKRMTQALARHAGVDFPRTWRPEDLRTPGREPLPFPVIIKPAVKDRDNALTHARAWEADTPRALHRLWERACRLMPPDLILVQELVPGGGEAQVSFAALCRDGVPVASLTARRTRQYPPRFGRSSSFVETVDLPEVAQAARRLLAAIRFNGLVEVELKFDRRDGAYKLLDINPRAWTWVGLGARAGVDFPWLQWQLLRGEPIAPVTARAGVRWARLTTDLLSALSHVVHGRLSLGDWARSWRRPLQLSHFEPDDPLPALVAIPAHFGMRVHRMLGRLRARA